LNYNKFRPVEWKRFLKNPHKGIVTCRQYDGEEPSLARAKCVLTGMEPVPPELLQPPALYLPSTVAYFRWYWEAFQPEEHRFDWSMMEEALDGVARHGQTLQVRLMPHGLGKRPAAVTDGALPAWYSRRYPLRESIRYNNPYITPVHDSPEFIRLWTDAIREFGRVFDGHPVLESVDAAFLGAWGEGGGVATDATIDTLTEAYRQAHPRTPLVTLIGGHKMTAGIRAGMGWRCDCFGDVRQWQNPDVPDGTGKAWNHHFDRYPMAVCECGAQEAWKTRPVIFETCATPMAWFANRFDLDFIIRQGLKYHGSFFMPHGAALPPLWLDRLGEFCNDLGYRFVLRQVQIEDPLPTGSRTEVTAWIENVGVAPIGRRYDFALCFRQGSRTHIHRSARNIRDWLPGDVFLREEVRLPSEFAAGGKTEVLAALIDRESEQPRVRFAAEGYGDDGWLPLGILTVGA
jgi:hypothetical protein